MENGTSGRGKPGLALGAGIAFLVAAIVEAVAGVTHHAPAWYSVSAAGFAGVALLWFIVYGSWKKNA